ncbi:MAG: hypothetical protein LM632_09610 [Armatimonadetes bacterium]|nr:hypothetical protein [Armatimonadota bacterium]
MFNCSIHATVFSQWLMTDLMSAEFIRRKILEGASPDVPRIFRQCRSTALQKNHSSIATHLSSFTIRQSLIASRHWLLAVVSARQKPRPPNFPVPRPTPLVPLKVGAQ